MNLKSTTANGLNFQIINSLMEFWGVRLTWLDFKTGWQNQHKWLRNDTGTQITTKISLF